MTEKKMLYIMHVDWNWIKQRPQYIEEALEKYFNIVIICPRNYRLKQYNDKNNCKVFYSIPFIRRYPGIWRIDAIRKKLKIHHHIKKFRPEYVYLTSPEYGECIPSNYSGRVIYDCMDDMLAFNSQSHFVKRVKKQESITVQRADVVLSTSERLRKILCKRYPDSINKFYLIRNGYDGSIANSPIVNQREVYTLCYFGTISHWFNFDFILRSLDDIPGLQYLLIGPVEGGTTVPMHDRLIHRTPVNHDELINATSEVDGFIMPFEINELILSVDPVKLYEYINFGKDILSVKYPEIERFGPFVHFYNDYNSFRDQIIRMMGSSKRKYSEEERLTFLKENDWKHRVDSIVTLLTKL